MTPKVQGAWRDVGFFVLGLAVMSLVCTALPAQANGKGSFFPQCRFVNAARVDPIMERGVKPSMHMHQFFGAVRVTKHSKPSGLLHKRTTCSAKADHTGYWAPVLKGKHGKIVHAPTVNAYYVTQGEKVRAIPRGIAIRGTRAKYTCGTGYWIDLDDRAPFSCKGRGHATGGNSAVFPKIEVYFPSCVHKGGAVRYEGPCKYHIPELQLAFRFTNRQSLAGLHPSSGKWRTMHADAMFAWHQGAFKHQIHRCLDPHRECTDILGKG